MSEPENFIARWSRRKREAAQEAEAEKPAAAPEAAPESARDDDQRFGNAPLRCDKYSLRTAEMARWDHALFNHSVDLAQRHIEEFSAFSDRCSWPLVPIVTRGDRAVLRSRTTPHEGPLHLRVPHPFASFAKGWGFPILGRN